MKPGRWSRPIVLLALALLTICLVWPPLRTWALFAALPLAIALAAGLKPKPRWGGWVATLMIPYFCVGIMNLLAGPAPPAIALILCLASAAAFIASMHWTRRMGVSLRR